MAVARMPMAALRTTSENEEDYSAYANMSDEELLQLAIERSLADTNLTPRQNQQMYSHAMPTTSSATQRAPCNPSPFSLPVTASANPPR